MISYTHVIIITCHSEKTPYYNRIMFNIAISLNTGNSLALILVVTLCLIFRDCESRFLSQICLTSFMQEKFLKRQPQKIAKCNRIAFFYYLNYNTLHYRTAT